MTISQTDSMRIVAEAEIRAAASIAAARSAVHGAFCALAEGSVIAPPELAMKLDHGGELHVKGAYLGGDSVEVASQVGALQHAPAIVDRAASLGNVVTGRAPGRRTAGQVTVADLCGLGIQDAAMAELVMAFHD